MGNNQLSLPTNFVQVDSLPNDPPESRAFMRQSEGTDAFVLVYPVPMSQAMPFDAPQNVIDEIHGALGDDQGLIEVETGVTASGKNYIYSIVKSAMPDPGMQYIMVMDIDEGEFANHVYSAFDESGVTGMRDSVIFSAFLGAGGSMEDWMCDPYDPSYDHGIMMNKSEAAKFDEHFPAHPLSECREFVRQIIAAN